MFRFVRVCPEANVGLAQSLTFSVGHTGRRPPATLQGNKSPQSNIRSNFLKKLPENLAFSAAALLQEGAKDGR